MALQLVLCSRTQLRLGGPNRDGCACRGLRKVPDAQVMQLQTRRGSSIVAALISYHLKDRPTLLFSHGNAVDLALMLPFYRHAKRAFPVSRSGQRANSCNGWRCSIAFDRARAHPLAWAGGWQHALLQQEVCLCPHAAARLVLLPWTLYRRA